VCKASQEERASSQEDKLFHIVRFYQCYSGS
jgi:hypothetical protein